MWDVHLLSHRNQEPNTAVFFRTQINLIRNNSEILIGLRRCQFSSMISCQRCRNKKVKCDKRSPCSNCMKSNNPCNFKVKLKPGRKPTREKVQITEKQSLAYIKLFLKYSNISESLGIDEEYLNTLKFHDCQLLLTGIHSIGAYLSGDRNSFHLLHRHFENELNDGKVTSQSKDSDCLAVLEFLQSLTLNCSILFMTARAKESMNLIFESLALLQVYDYHLVDFIAQPNTKLIVMRRNICWYLFEMSCYACVGTGIQSFSVSILQYVNLPDGESKETHEIRNLRPRDLLLLFLIRFQNTTLLPKQLHYACLHWKEIDETTKAKTYKAFENHKSEIHQFIAEVKELPFSEPVLNRLVVSLYVLGVLPLIQAMVEFLKSPGDNMTQEERELLNSCYKDINDVCPTLMKYVQNIDFLNFQGDAFLLFANHLVLKILLYNLSNINDQEGKPLLETIIRIMDTLSRNYQNRISAKVMDDYNSKVENVWFRNLVWFEDDEIESTSYFNDFIRDDVYRRKDSKVKKTVSDSYPNI